MNNYDKSDNSSDINKAIEKLNCFESLNNWPNCCLPKY